MSRKLKDRLGCPGCFNCLPPVVPAAHPSFPRSLSPTPIRERESIPPLTRHSRERGNPYGLDAGLSSDKPKVHGKTEVVAKTKTPCEAGQGVLVVCYPSYPPLTRLSREVCPLPRSGSGNPSRRSPVIPAEAGIHTYLMLDCHWTSPKCMGKQESSRKLEDPVMAGQGVSIVCGDPVMVGLVESFPVHGLGPSADPGRRWRLPAPTAHRSGRGGGRCLASGYAGDGPQHTAYALDLAGDQLGHLRHVGCFD